MRYRVLIGAAAVLTGVLVLFDRGLAGVIDFSFVAVTLVGAFALVQGLRYANARRRTERRSLDPGEPERRARAAVPGAEFDADLARVMGAGYRRYTLRNRLRDRVRTVAIAATVRDRSCSQDRAATLVDGGEWTDDPIAAAFLSSEVPYPLGHRVRTRLLGRSTFRTGLDAAMDAIERADPLDPVGTESPGIAGGGEGGGDRDTGEHPTTTGESSG